MNFAKFLRTIIFLTGLFQWLILYESNDSKVFLSILEVPAKILLIFEISSVVNDSFCYICLFFWIIALTSSVVHRIFSFQCIFFKNMIKSLDNLQLISHIKEIWKGILLFWCIYRDTPILHIPPFSKFFQAPSLPPLPPPIPKFFLFCFCFLPCFFGWMCVVPHLMCSFA